jgi:hypothetical protein
MAKSALVWFVLLATVCLYIAFLTGCGSSSASKSTPPPPQIAVSLSAPGSNGGTVTLGLGQNLAIVALVVNDSSSAGVTWSLSGPGTLSSQTTSSVEYTAPSSLQSTATATVTATSIAESTQSSSLKITINPPITVTISPSSPQTICVGQTVPITATVSYDPENAGVQWSLLVPPGQYGSLSNETATSVVYNAPTGFNHQDGQGVPIVAPVIATVTNSALTAQLTIDSNFMTSYDGPFPAATFTQLYSFTLPNPVCGKPPFTWSAPYGMPAGLTVSGNVISGVPTYPASNSSFFLTVTDSTTPVPNAAQSILDTITINLPTVLTILTSSLPLGDVGGNYSQTLLATAGTPPYNWSISAGRLPPGLNINSSTGAISGTITATGTYNFTAKVTDSATPVPNTAIANLSIGTYPQLAITTTSLPSGTVGTAYVQQLQASGGAPGYIFVLQSGTLPPGLTINASGNGLIAGSPTETGTSNFTVMVTDGQGATATAPLSIQIAAADCPNNASLDGSYAFLLSGPGFGGPSSFYDYVGSLTADGAGNITQGYIDSQSTFASGTPGTLTGTYCISANNLGTVTLNGFSGDLVPSSDVFEIALQSDGNANATIYQNVPGPLGDDAPLAISGVILKQDVSAFNTNKINGNYAFQLVNSGPPNNNLGQGGVTSAEAGAFSADGSGNLNGVLDFNTAMLNVGYANDAAFTANDLVVSSTGRGTVTFTTNVTELNPLPTIFYVVNSSQLLVLQYVPNGPLMAGQIVQQTGAPYSTGSLNGVSVSGTQQYDNNYYSDSPLVQVGLMTWDGAGNLSWTTDQNDNGVMSTPSYNWTYVVASNGRVTFNPGLFGPSPTILYLTGPNQGFLYDPNGQIMSQSEGTFSNGSFAGTYFGGNWQALGNPTLQVDLLTSDGVSIVTGTSDSDSPGGPLPPASISGTYAVSSNGRGTITQNGSVTGIFYMVSPTQILLIPNATPNPTVIQLSH